MNISDAYKNEYKHFVEIKRDDYVYLWHNLLDAHHSGYQVMSSEQLKIAEQRFNYWNRSIEDIMDSFIKRYENIDITPMQLTNKSHFDEYFTAKEEETVLAVSA